jgi:hypothetical protein
MANNRDLSQFASTVGYNGGSIGIGTDNPVGSLEVRDSKANLIVAKDGLTVKSNSDLHTSYDTLQIGAGGALLSYSVATVTADTQFVHNAYRSSGGTFKYRYADTATRLRMNAPGGTLIFDNAASGSADADITFSERLRITSGGSVGFNTTLTQSSKTVHIAGDYRTTTSNVADEGLIFQSFSSASTGDVYPGISWTGNPGALGRARASINAVATNDNNGSDIVFLTRNAADGTELDVNDDERLRITKDGRVLLGHNSNVTPYVAGKFQLSATDSSAALSIARYQNSSSNPYLALVKSRGGLGNATIVQDNDGLGYITFVGADGNDLTSEGAAIAAEVDGTPGQDDMPGALIFKTTSDGNNSASERFRITSGGKIQVTGTRGGTLQPSDDDTLELYTKATSGNANTGGGITFYNNHGNGHVMGGVIHVVKQNGTYENSQSDMLFGTRINGSSVAYRARLTSHGSWETFSSTVNIDIANSQSSGNNEAFIYARYGSTALSAGSLSFRVYTNGNVQNTNNSYGSISDQNLKENIIDATSQWDDIKALQVRKYNFREATGHQTHTQIGLIAQEVESVSPGLVETTAVREGETCQDADGNQLESIKSINYSVLYMKAIKALQEAQTRIETLESQHADLLARVTALEGS